MSESTLEARALVKSFGRVQALRGASFAAYPGEVTALVNQMFARRAPEAPQDRTQVRSGGVSGKKHLH